MVSVCKWIILRPSVVEITLSEVHDRRVVLFLVLDWFEVLVLHRLDYRLERAALRDLCCYEADCTIGVFRSGSHCPSVVFQS